MDAAVEIPDLFFLNAENNLSMVFHGNDTHGMVFRSHFQESGVSATGCNECSASGTDQRINCSPYRDHSYRMHGAGSANDGVYRTRLNTLVQPIQLFSSITATIRAGVSLALRHPAAVARH